MVTISLYINCAGHYHWSTNIYSLHRITGPAVIYSFKSGEKQKVWYYKNKYIDVFYQDEFERYLKYRILW
jgi:hypothetical protein